MVVVAASVAIAVIVVVVVQVVLYSEKLRAATLLTQLKQFSYHDGSSAAEALRFPNQSQQIMSSSISDERSFMEPDFAMDFSGTLFSTFNQMFPDPKEICN